MSTTQREVLLEVYVNGDLYCGDSFWASDEGDVQVEFQITDAIYDLLGCTSQEVDVQVEVETHDVSSVCYWTSEDVDVLLVGSEINQDCINASSKTAEEKNSTEDQTEEAGSSSAMDASPETPEENSECQHPELDIHDSKESYVPGSVSFELEPELDMYDPKESHIPGSLKCEPEPELDLVDPGGSSVPGPSSFDPGPVYSQGLDVGANSGISEVKRSALASEDPAEEAGSSSAINQSGLDASPETPKEKDPTASTKVGTMKLKKNDFFQRLFSSSSQHEKDPIPGLSSVQPELSSDSLVDVCDSQLYEKTLKVVARLNRCKLSLTPVTEVWGNVFIGDEETARDRAKLVEMGITHILNAAAPMRNLRSLVGMEKKKSLRGKIHTGAKYYRGMNITYCGLPTTYQQFNITKYFVPAARFIKEALRDPENKVLIHCRHGVSHSPTLFLAHLMMRYKMPLEEALDHVLKVRRIKPFISFLLQLASLDHTPANQQKQPSPGIRIRT